jgi:hypothetical protein
MKTTALSTAIIPLVLLVSTTSIARAETTNSQVPTNQSPTVRPANSVGLEVEGQQRNAITLHRTNYEGDCPGTAITQPKATFVADHMPTAKKRRVRVENVTPGLKTTPYTDREYKSNNRSESTTLDLDYGHTLRYFRIIPGENRFTYRITERKELLDAGEFTAQVNIKDSFQTRNAKWYDAEVCSNVIVALKNCADIRFVKQFRCPDGRVLKSEQRDQGAYYRTILSNRSNRDVEVQFEHHKYHLKPGENVSLQTSNRFSFSLSISYRIGQESWQSTSVTPATYMQFRQSGHGDRVEFTTYDRDDHSSSAYKFRDHSGRPDAEQCRSGHCVERF